MISFIKMKLISPAIIGGANARDLEETQTIRIPQIRGQLRFWTRALAGGRTYHASNCLKIVKLTEENIFGGTNLGSRIQFMPVEIENARIRNFKLFPHKSRPIEQTNMKMIAPDSGIITLKFNTDKVPARYLNPLKAVLWIWLHLGSIGKRSRRGFGSLQWLPASGDFLSDLFTFEPDEDLKSPDALREYLFHGLSKVNEIWKIPYLKNRNRGTYPFFCLHTIDQIFVGKIFHDADNNPIQKIDDNVGGIIHRMHGMTLGGEQSEWELGHKKKKGKKRQASPMMWRLYKLKAGYVPLLVWSPLTVTQIDKKSNVYGYLNGKLGFDSSLMENGSPLGNKH